MAQLKPKNGGKRVEVRFDLSQLVEGENLPGEEENRPLGQVQVQTFWNNIT